MSEENRKESVWDANGVSRLELNETLAEVSSDNVNAKVPPDMLGRWKADNDFLLKECIKYRACAIIIGKLYRQLQAEKDKRYKNRQTMNERTASEFKLWKAFGLSDADAFRNMIGFEYPWLKPSDPAYKAHMDRLRMWKSRHKEELQHID